jgi:hypothetical protein
MEVDTLRLLDVFSDLPFEDRILVKEAAACLDEMFSKRRTQKTKGKSSKRIKRLPLDSKVAARPAYPDHLVTPRLLVKCRPEPSLLKDMMCKKVDRSVRQWCHAWKASYSIDT